MGLSSPFIERLNESVLVADGGMGTLLHEKGISFGTSFDLLCLENEELVKSIHCDYISAGIDVLETNSFGANAIRLKTFSAEDKTEVINRQAARIARAARDEMGRDLFVAGAIGPTGRRAIQIDHPMYDEMFDAFRRQVEGLLEGGVDLFILETFSDIKELKIAIDVIRSLSKLPLVAQATFSYDGLTNLGHSPAEAVAMLDKCQIDMIGANCSVGPQPLIDVIHEMSQCTDRPLSAMPNAGLPRYIDGRYLYYTSPEYFAATAAEFIKRGVRLIGGCCGTTPDHIRKLVEVVRAGGVFKEKTTFQPLYAVSTSDEKPSQAPESENSFRKKLGRELVISVEIDPPLGSNPNKVLKGARYLAGLGIDAINVADSPMGRARMSALAAAVMIFQATGKETILHLTCRDQNMMGLQSSLLGGNALGIKNILAITGDPPSGDYPNVTAVYDVDAIGLLQIIKSLNGGRGITGAKIGYPTDILSGAAVNPTSDDDKTEIERLKKKIDSGAAYFMTQPIFDIDGLKRFQDKTASLDVTMVMGVLPLHSLRHALFLNNEVPGIDIPVKVIERIEKAGEKAHEAGIDIAAEISEAGRQYVAGLYYMPSFGRYETIGAVLKQIGLTTTP